MADSPLSVAAPDSLQELFDRDPLQLTDDNIETIVQTLRASRENWIKQEAKPKKIAAPATLQLSDLSL